MVSLPRPASLAYAIEVEGVRFDYPGVCALNDVSFTVERGSVTALVGPNGAGKTTLLRCIAALERPLLGSIRVAGIDVLEEPRACHRRIGFLADTYGLYEALSVRQCLAYAARASGLAAAAVPGTVARTAARLDITAKLDVLAGALSRGQRQRVAIGQAVIHAPEVLILDEPASGLDPEARHSLAGLFTRLQEEGMTLLVSSHILAELDAYSTHMLVLRAGQVIEHRPLSHATPAGTRVQVELATPLTGWHEQVRPWAGVQVLSAEARTGTLLIHGDSMAQALVLKQLVEAGLPVTAFHAERENLHDSYLRTVRGGTAP
ncbi:MAG: ABC transporter ATP-binding protein [Candidatus Tectimicrobiota bacterium]